MEELRAPRRRQVDQADVLPQRAEEHRVVAHADAPEHVLPARRLEMSALPAEHDRRRRHIDEPPRLRQLLGDLLDRPEVSDDDRGDRVVLHPRAGPVPPVLGTPAPFELTVRPAVVQRRRRSASTKRQVLRHAAAYRNPIRHSQRGP